MNEWPPMGAVLIGRGAVFGEAKPAGSKVSGVAYRNDGKGGKVPVMRNGKIVTFTKDTSGKAGEAWRGDVQASVRAALQHLQPLDHPQGLLDGPLALELCFYRPRLKGHYGSGRNAGVLKPSAPAYPTTRPDTTKLVRAFEDALTSVVWRDDSQLVELRTSKAWGEPARVEWLLWTLGHTAEATGGTVLTLDLEQPTSPDEQQEAEDANGEAGGRSTAGGNGDGPAAVPGVFD